MTATAISGASGPRGREQTDHQMCVVIADDSVLLREGIARLLVESGFEVVGQAGDADDLLRKVGAHKPDIAVVDVRMPPTHTDEGLRAAHRIRAEYPETAVLVLSQYLEEAYALELLSESTERTGYLLKDRVADVRTFTDAVRRVARGGSALDPEVVGLMLGRRRREDPLATLTSREREVLGLMAEGRSNTASTRRWSSAAGGRASLDRIAVTCFSACPALNRHKRPGRQNEAHTVTANWSSCRA
jgi:DNA-binding NarL/FixJ family response regulator